MFKPIWPNCPIAEPSTVNQIPHRIHPNSKQHLLCILIAFSVAQTYPFRPLVSSQSSLSRLRVGTPTRPSGLLKKKHTHTPLHHHMEQRPQREATAAPNFTPRAFLKPQTACLQGNCAGLCVWQLFTSLHIHKYIDKYVHIYIYVFVRIYIIPRCIYIYT